MRNRFKKLLSVKKKHLYFFRQEISVPQFSRNVYEEESE